MKVNITFYSVVVLAITAMCCCLLNGCDPNPGSFSSTEKIQPAELRQDLAFLLKTVQTSNPAPYHNTSEAIIDSIKKDIELKINRPMTGMEFYRLVRPLVSAFNDGHFSIFADRYFKDYQDHGGRLFPFTVLIDGDRLYINQSLSKDSIIPKGTEVLSVNNVPVKTLIKILMKFYSGDSDPYKLSVVEKRFDTGLWKAYGFLKTFKILAGNGKLYTTAGVPAKVAEDQHQKQEPFKLRLLPKGNVAYINISTLEFGDKAEMTNFLAKTFAQIKKWGSDNLIIDIRDNGGGSTLLAREIFNYITTTPYSVSWEETAYDKGKPVTYKDGLTNLTIPANKANKFTGKVYLLFNAASYSSAHMMANTFMYYKFGVTVGDSSAERMVISGEVGEYTLPNSRLNGYCPSSIFMLPHVAGKNARLVPNYLIIPTLNDRLNGGDKQLQFCLKVIADDKIKTEQ